MTETFFIK